MQQAFKTLMGQMNTQDGQFNNAAFPPGSPFPFPSAPASGPFASPFPATSQHSTVDVSATRVDATPAAPAAPASSVTQAAQATPATPTSPATPATDANNDTELKKKSNSFGMAFNIYIFMLFLFTYYFPSLGLVIHDIISFSKVQIYWFL